MVAPRPRGPVTFCPAHRHDGREKSVKAPVLALVKKPETVKTALFAVIAVITWRRYSSSRRNSAQPTRRSSPPFLDQVRTRVPSLGKSPHSSQFPPAYLRPRALVQPEISSLKVRPRLQEGDNWTVHEPRLSKLQNRVIPRRTERQCFIARAPLVLYPTADRDLETAPPLLAHPDRGRHPAGPWTLQREENSVERWPPPVDTINRSRSWAGRMCRRTDYSGSTGSRTSGP